AQTGVPGPTFEVAAGAVITAHESEPTGSCKLRRDTGRELSIGADAGRIGQDGVGDAPKWVLRTGSRTLKHAAGTGHIAGPDVAGKLMEHAGDEERRHRPVAGSV